MKLFLKLYGVHILYVLFASLLVGFTLDAIVIVDAFQTGHLRDKSIEILFAFPLMMSVIPAIITSYTWGLYWLIPLGYFFKKTNKYLIWILCVEVITTLLFTLIINVIFLRISISMSAFILAYYKYKHISRILRDSEH